MEFLPDAAITRTLDELDAVLPISEFRDDLIASLRRAYTPGIGMAENMPSSCSQTYTSLACWFQSSSTSAI